MFSRYFIISAMLLQAGCVYISEPDVGTSATGSFIDDGWNDEREDGAPVQNDSAPDIDGTSHESDNVAGNSGAEQNEPAETNCVEDPEEQVGDDNQTDDDVSESEDPDNERESTDCSDETQSVEGDDGNEEVDSDSGETDSSETPVVEDGAENSIDDGVNEPENIESEREDGEQNEGIE